MFSIPAVEIGSTFFTFVCLAIPHPGGGSGADGLALLIRDFWRIRLFFPQRMLATYPSASITHWGKIQGRHGMAMVCTKERKREIFKVGCWTC